MAKRRGRNDGGLFELASGRWAAEVSLGYDANGKRIRQRVTGATKGEAKKALDDLLEKSVRGVRPSKQTVGEYLDHWLENTVKVNLRAKTVHCYSEVIRLYLRPALGQVVLTELHRQDVERLLAGMVKDGKSPRMRQLVYAVLSSALKAAGDTLPKDPLRGIARPRVEKHRPEVGQDVFTHEQAKAFLAAADVPTNRYYAAMFLLLTTGARIGEILALHREDVDLKAGTLRIRHTLTEVQGVIIGRFPTKTKAGDRTLTLSQTELRTLRLHLMGLNAEGLGQSVMLFPARRTVKNMASRGDYMPQDHVRDAMRRICEANNLPGVKLHSLRHASASFMLAAGIDVATVSKRLGHSKVSVTLDTYVHALPQKDGEAAKTMEMILGGGQ